MRSLPRMTIYDLLLGGKGNAHKKENGLLFFTVGMQISPGTLHEGYGWLRKEERRSTVFSEFTLW